MIARAVVFDFDGVIVDSEPLHERACLVAARSEGMTFTHEDFVARCIGHGDRLAFDAIARLNTREPDADLIARLCERKTGAFLELLLEEAPAPHAGSVELIHAAAARGPIAVCTGSRRDEVEPILDRLGVLDLLTTLVTADDVERTKPDPAPYALAARRLETPPTACVAIEDTPTGIASALAAGLRVLGVAQTLPRERLSEAHRVADALAFLTLDEILSI